MLVENTKLAFKSMWANKMRTLLSLLGIVIGVASVVAILTLGQSVTKSVTDTMASGGLDTITIYTTNSSKTADTFTELFGEDLKNSFAGIQSVSPMVLSSGTRVRYQKEIQNVTIYGVQSNWASVMSYEAADGSWFSAEDNIQRRQVVVLGSNVAEKLFPGGNAVGQYVSIFRQQSKSYLVVGVMEEKESSMTASYNNSVYIPYNTYSQRFRKVTMPENYIVKLEEDVDAVTMSDVISEYLDGLVGSDYYSIFSAATLAEIASSVTGTISIFLAAIAGISLLVGGIGIMNIMLVSVAERTKEIGIRKALGAKPRTIRGQFITESIVVTLVGGLIGILLGTALSKAVAGLAGWTFHVSVNSYIISVGFSMVIGVFFGWYPAKKASRLDPIEALNYE